MMPATNKLFRFLILLLFFVFIAALIPGLTGFGDDMNFFKDWAVNISQHGLKNAYTSGIAYPPVYQYFLWVYQEFAGPDVANLIARIGYLRLLTLVMDLVGLWYVYKWLDKKTDFLLLFFFSMFNIAYSYNTIIWGQIDAILAAFVFMSIYYAYQQKTVLSCIWYFIAFNFKVQAIIFLPIVGLLLLHHPLDRKFVRSIALSIGAVICLEVILVAPFIQTRESIEFLYGAVFGSVDRYPFISMKAFNIWYWVFPNTSMFTPDSTVWFGDLSYKRVGLFWFCISSLVILWPLLIHTGRVVFKKDEIDKFSQTRLWLICAAIPLVFFFFNTQMHERYSHPAFIFLTVYAFYSRDFIPYVLFSIAYFLNLEKVLKWLKLENYDTLIFDARFISGIYIMLILYIVYRIYIPVKERTEENIAVAENLLTLRTE